MKICIKKADVRLKARICCPDKGNRPKWAETVQGQMGHQIPENIQIQNHVNLKHSLVIGTKSTKFVIFAIQYRY